MFPVSEKVAEWLEVRKREALEIDPETAELDWWYVCDFDPYGVYPDLPEELQQVGRGHFARRPGGDIWVSFDDLPDDVRDKLWKRAEHLTFVADQQGIRVVGLPREFGNS